MTPRSERVAARPLAVFDLDGTLVDTAPDIALHLNRAFSRRDWPPLTVDAVRAMIGDGAARLVDRALIASGRDPDEAPGVVADFLASYQAQPLIHSAPYPGVPDALRAASASGWRLAVCTNKPHNIALRVLSGLGLSFEGVIGGGVLPARKPDPAPLLAVIAECGGDVARTVLVGDSVADAGAARSAGVAFIAVDFGYHHGPPSILAPDAWLSRFADLAAVLDSVERRFLTGPSGG